MYKTKISRTINVLCVCVGLISNVIVAQSDGNDCFTPKNEAGECIVLPQCPSIFQILQQRPVSVESLDYVQQSTCGFLGQEPKVCCPLRSSVTTATTNAPKYSASSPQSSSLLPEDCGTNLASRIIGGRAVFLGEFPWMALLEYQTRTGKGFYCGGVLINNRYVLTAAHCIKGKDLPPSWRLISVRLGEHNVSSAVDCESLGAIGTICSTKPVDVPIESQIAHEEYEPNDINQYNDIAILRLSEPVQFTDFIQPICVPKDTLLRKSFEGETMIVAGWGKTEKKSSSEVILKLDVEVRKNTECAQTYKSVRVQIDDGQLCAGGRKGQDSCRGDSGGPLMQQTNINSTSNYYIFGVVSFGPSPCGMQGWPGVYTRVTKHVPWIISKLKP